MIIAVDIGGTKTLIASFDDSGKMGEMHRIDTLKDFDTFFGEVTEKLANFNPQASDIIVVASAGMVDREHGVILHSPNLGWNNVRLKTLLVTQYKCPVYLEND